MGGARTVLNVGAGAGSYEPRDRAATAVEPSETMREQRPPELPVAVDAVAEALPFEDGSFEASMAIFTVHQWHDLDAGLAELRRVSKGPVVIPTCDPTAVDCFWLNEYAPEVISTMTRRDPPLRRLTDALGARSASEERLDQQRRGEDGEDGRGDAVQDSVQARLPDEDVPDRAGREPDRHVDGEAHRLKDQPEREQL